MIDVRPVCSHGSNVFSDEAKIAGILAGIGHLARFVIPAASQEETVIASSDSVHSVCFTDGVDEIIRIIREQIAEKLHVLIGVLVVCVYACRKNPFG